MSACTPGGEFHPVPVYTAAAARAAPFSLHRFLPSSISAHALSAAPDAHSIVEDYAPIAPDAANSLRATLGGGGGARAGASGALLEGESWRGGFAGGSPVGVHSAPRVSYYFPKGVGEYHFGERHPMKPHRLTLTNHLVMGYGLHRQMDMYEPRPASKDELELFHDQDYVDFLARVTPDNVRHFTSVLSRFNIGDDCPIFSGMYAYCQQYAGASLMAARKLVAGTTDIAVNWTGGLHHAKKSEASGFCYVNDIVLAILELLRVHARVLYIDIDIHHGDGVQEAFYNTNRVLTVSFHKYSPDFFPGTGHIDELGHALGKNFSLNVPLQDGIDNESYVALFKSIMEPTIGTYRPSAIVLQCGADSLGADRLGCFNLSIAAHGECVRFIKSFNLPLVVLGGGGYTIKNVSRCWTYETAVLLGLEQDLPNALPHTAYDDFFAPDWKLHPELAQGRARLENLNSREQLERIRRGLLERVRYMHGAPGVQMREVPPSLASWIADEDEREERELGGGEGLGKDGEEERSGDRGDYFSSSTTTTTTAAETLAGGAPIATAPRRPRMTAPLSTPSAAGGGGGGGGGGATSAASTAPPKKRRKAVAVRGTEAQGPVPGLPSLPPPPASESASVPAPGSASALTASQGKVRTGGATPGGGGAGGGGLKGAAEMPAPGNVATDSAMRPRPRMDPGGAEDEV